MEFKQLPRFLGGLALERYEQDEAKILADEITTSDPQKAAALQTALQAEQQVRANNPTPPDLQYFASLGVALATVESARETLEGASIRT